MMWSIYCVWKRCMCMYSIAHFVRTFDMHTYIYNKKYIFREVFRCEGGYVEQMRCRWHIKLSVWICVSDRSVWTTDGMLQNNNAKLCDVAFRDWRWLFFGTRDDNHNHNSAASVLADVPNVRDVERDWLEGDSKSSNIIRIYRTIDEANSIRIMLMINYYCAVSEDVRSVEIHSSERIENLYFTNWIRSCTLNPLVRHWTTSAHCPTNCRIAGRTAEPMESYFNNTFASFSTHSTPKTQRNHTNIHKHTHTHPNNIYTIIFIR